jgi:hypothetical protein
MNDVRVPLWVAGALFAAFLSVAGWSAQAVLDLRDRATRNESRINSLEQRPAPADLSDELARMAEQIKALTESVRDLREDLRGVRRSPPK